MFKLYFQVVYYGIQYIFMEKNLMAESKWATLYMSYNISIAIMYIYYKCLIHNVKMLKN